MSHFTFLQREWPDLCKAPAKAEAGACTDPRTACFYARRALELAMAWAYKHDASLKLPYQDNLSALIHEPSFKNTAGEAVFSKARVIATLGNRAVHSHRVIPPDDAVVAVRELFHVAFWFARTYGRVSRPAPGLAFDADALPKRAPVPKQTAEQLKQLEATLHERDEHLASLLADKSALDEELKRLRAEVAEAKKAAAAQPDTHDYSEAETRDYFIDLLLKEAGWALDQPRDRELEFFSQDLPVTDGRVGETLGTRLFKARLDLIGELDSRIEPVAARAAEPAAPAFVETKTDAEVRRSTAEMLHHEVESMNLENFVVRPKRRLVEKYAKADAWVVLPSDARSPVRWRRKARSRWFRPRCRCYSTSRPTSGGRMSRCRCSRACAAASGASYN